MKGFVSSMKRFALEKMAAEKSWFVIEFCSLGFIGKLFKSTDLPWLVQFLLMFYNDKPVDWLLDDLLRTIKYTNPASETGKIRYSTGPRYEMKLTSRNMYHI